MSTRLLTALAVIGLVAASWAQIMPHVEGAAFGADALVNESLQSGRGSPDLAIDTNGRIHAVWDDSRSGNYDIYVSSSANNGASFGADVRVDNDAADQRNPAIATRGANNLYVVWQDYRSGNWDIYFARSTNGGASFGTPVKVSAALLSSEQSSPDIAVAGNGNICVVWQDFRNNNWDIYSAMSLDGGTSFEANVRVNSNPSITVSQRFPAVAFNGENSVFVAWQDDRNGNWDIYMARSTNNGASFQTEIRVTDHNGNQSFPDTVIDSRNHIYVVWEDYRNGNWDIYTSRSTNSGNSFSTNMRVNGVSNDDQRRPSAFADRNDHLHVAWHDSRAGNDHIYYSKSTNGGDSFGGDFRVCDQIGTASTDGAAIVVNSNMNPGIAWLDSRAGSENVYFATGVNNAPACYISYPMNGATVSGTITVTGTASDPDGNQELVRVEVRINSENWETAAGTSTWTYLLNTNSLSDGPHVIHARAFDGDLHSTIVSVNIIVNNPSNAAPEVAIWSPGPGTTLSGREAVISGNATDPDGDPIFYVQVRVDGGSWMTATGTNNWAGWVYSLDTTALSNGMHTIYARAYDGALYTSPPASVSVFVSNAGSNNPPTVSITKPVEGQRIAGNYIIEGTASDSDGNLQVMSVEVRIGDGAWSSAIPVAGEGNWTAWVYYISADGMAPGEYTIHARAYDGMDYSGLSSVTFVLAPQTDGGGWLLYLLAGIIIALVILLLLIMKGRKKKEPVSYTLQPAQTPEFTGSAPPPPPPEYPGR